MPITIDLNADVGESYGAWTMGDDASLLPLVTSANVACGAHAGDPTVMARTVALARRLGVSVGAHPGYPDRDGFGRRDLPMTAEELRASLLAQLGALDAIARSVGATLRHVKPHGALYSRAAVDTEFAEIIAWAVREVSPSLILVGLAGSALLTAGTAAGLAVAAEAFADRAYESDGSLRSRRFPDAVHHDPEIAAAQARSIVVDGRVRAHDGSWVTVHAHTLCIHGDSPGAPAMATAVRAALAEAGARVAPLGSAP
jgi:5-oxoprolinase (ATP-hydrolysing) subunit A